MTVKYDLEKLRVILADYTRLTGLSISVTDTACNQIAVSHADRSIFCERIHDCAGGTEKCRCSDQELLRRCAESHRPEFHVCHAGLSDAAVPIEKDGYLLGYVLLGRIRTGETLDSLGHRLDWIGMNRAELESCYQKLVRYDDAQIASAVNLAVAITTYILVDDMVTMEYNPIVEQTVAYIRSHLSAELNVDQICGALDISRSRLYAQFRQAMRSSVGEYIIQCRMEQAARLLHTTDLSLTAVAETVGIQNYTYFIKSFKKRTGLTPMQYRKQGG